MNNLARRAALKFGFGAALAAPTAAAQLQAHLTGGAFLGGFLPGQPVAGYATNMDPIKRAALRLFRQKDREHDRRLRYRVGAFDHDVAVCGSWSLAFKANVQRGRDDEARSILDKFRIAAWGDDD